MQKHLFSVAALACACLFVFSSGVRAEEKLSPERETYVRDFTVEKDKVDSGEWISAASGEEAAIDAEKDGKRGELWHPVLARLKKLAEEHRDGKIGSKDVHAHLMAIKEKHPELWQRLVLRVREYRMAHEKHMK